MPPLINAVIICILLSQKQKASVIQEGGVLAPVPLQTAINTHADTQRALCHSAEALPVDFGLPSGELVRPGSIASTVYVGLSA